MPVFCWLEKTPDPFWVLQWGELLFQLIGGCLSQDQCQCKWSNLCKKLNSQLEAGKEVLSCTSSSRRCRKDCPNTGKVAKERKHRPYMCRLKFSIWRRHLGVSNGKAHCPSSPNDGVYSFCRQVRPGLRGTPDWKMSLNFKGFCHSLGNVIRIQ